MSTVTFTRVAQTHDEATGQVTPTRVTISAAAFAVLDDESFRPFGLLTENQVVLQATTLPTVDRPRAGDTFVWGTDQAGAPQVWTVARVKPFSMNGVDVIASYVLGEK